MYFYLDITGSMESINDWWRMSRKTAKVLCYLAFGDLEGRFQMLIDTPRGITETLYFSLRCVDYLLGKDLRYVVDSKVHKIYNLFQRCVDLVAEILTGQGLLNELPTDWVKSD